MWKFFLAGKNGDPVDVTDDGCVSVVDCGAPPLKTQQVKIFSQFLTDDGLVTGSNDMGIDGSATPVEFYLSAAAKTDIYITRLTFLLGYGTSAEMFEFADSGAALTNGVKISYFDSSGDEVIIATPKANVSFMRASGILVTNTNWETRGFAAAGDYGFFVNIFLKDIMPPYGIKLDLGTTERLCAVIQDNCTDADLFNCQVFGFERIK